jgi:hypothetical protein
MIAKEKLTELTSKLKAEHPGRELRLLTLAGEQVIVVSPSPAEFQMFKDKVNAEKSDALESLTLACTVHPAGPELEALLERKPGLVVPIGNKLKELAGVVEEVEEKKL